ncbi:hypothetical protein B484DRAFT_445640 [Ochromonadaceae sp. CCMP2298]|nr:hypothetical protein B484DRAFT_445640 [Ochromonadaceae sp. CCMP2298]
MAAIEKLRQQRPCGGITVSVSVGSMTGLPLPPPCSGMSSFAPSLPPPNPAGQTEEQTEEQAEEEYEYVEQGGNGADDALFAQLLEACRQAGYDADHGKRRQLIAIIEGVQGGGAFPADILQPVLQATGLSEVRAMRMLKPQLHVVLAGMREAVAAEEERLQEMARLQEAERAVAQATHEARVQRLRVMGVCVMGFSWHRSGSGWRCAGGSHFCSDADLPVL